MLQQLWIDSQRPKTLQALSYHSDISQILQQIAKKDDFSHMIFYGPNGAGKKTRALCFAAQIFGSGIYKMRSEQKSVKLQSVNSPFEFTTLSSNHHIQLTPSDTPNRDRHIIQHVVKQIAQNADVQNGTTSKKKFKLLIINQADDLSHQAQGALRRTMQKYMTNCRIILICQHIHKLIAPIKSRCLNIRIPAPTNDQVKQGLTNVLKNFTSFTVSQQNINQVVKQSKRNMRQAIMRLQTLAHSGKMYTYHPYKKQINQLYKKLQQTPNIDTLISTRDTLYDLIGNLIEPSDIIRQLLSLSEKSQLLGGNQHAMRQIVRQACIHDFGVQNGNRPIIHLQSFCAVLIEQIILVKERI